MKTILTILICTWSFSIYGQLEEELTSQADGFYQAGDYNRAIVTYRKALEENGDYAPALYNMGNAFYQSGNFDKAREYFEKAALNSEEDNEKADAYSNLANSYVMSAQEISQKSRQARASGDKEDPFVYLKEGVEAYKKALRINPDDQETRENLALTQQLLKLEPPENSSGKDDKQQQQDPQQPEDKDDQQDQSQDQDDQQKDDQQKPEQQSEQQQQMSKKDAERILDAIDQEEKKMRQRMNLKKARQKPRFIEKDW